MNKGLKLAAAVLCAAVLGACGKGDGGAAAGDGAITVGFSQVGAESEWRTANTESIKSAAKEAGIELKFSDA